MCCPSVRRLTGCFAAVAALCLPIPVTAQETPASKPVSEMSIQDLLRVEVVSTASKFPQAIREAPASITVVTSEEIRRFGHRTLADVLRSVRGFYTTYDRNYAYVGMRGFARPGDYNTRFLLLVDGHRLNDTRRRRGRYRRTDGPRLAARFHPLSGRAPRPSGGIGASQHRGPQLRQTARPTVANCHVRPAS